MIFLFPALLQASYPDIGEVSIYCLSSDETPFCPSDSIPLQYPINWSVITFEYSTIYNYINDLRIDLSDPNVKKVVIRNEGASHLTLFGVSSIYEDKYAEYNRVPCISDKLYVNCKNVDFYAEEALHFVFYSKFDMINVTIVINKNLSIYQYPTLSPRYYSANERVLICRNDSKITPLFVTFGIGNFSCYTWLKIAENENIIHDYAEHFCYGGYAKCREFAQAPILLFLHSYQFADIRDKENEKLDSNLYITKDFTYDDGFYSQYKYFMNCYISDDASLTLIHRRPTHEFNNVVEMSTGLRFLKGKVIIHVQLPILKISYFIPSSSQETAKFVFKIAGDEMNRQSVILDVQNDIPESPLNAPVIEILGNNTQVYSELYNPQTFVINNIDFSHQFKFSNCELVNNHYCFDTTNRCQEMFTNSSINPDFTELIKSMVNPTFYFYSLPSRITIPTSYQCTIYTFPSLDPNSLIVNFEWDSFFNLQPWQLYISSIRFQSLYGVCILCSSRQLEFQGDGVDHHLEGMINFTIIGSLYDIVVTGKSSICHQTKPWKPIFSVTYPHLPGIFKISNENSYLYRYQLLFTSDNRELSMNKWTKICLNSSSPCIGEPGDAFINRSEFLSGDNILTNIPNNSIETYVDVLIQTEGEGSWYFKGITDFKSLNGLIVLDQVIIDVDCRVTIELNSSISFNNSFDFRNTYVTFLLMNDVIVTSKIISKISNKISVIKDSSVPGEISLNFFKYLSPRSNVLDLFTIGTDIRIISKNFVCFGTPNDCDTLSNDSYVESTPYQLKYDNIFHVRKIYLADSYTELTYFIFPGETEIIMKDKTTMIRLYTNEIQIDAKGFKTNNLRIPKGQVKIFTQSTLLFIDYIQNPNVRELSVFIDLNIKNIVSTIKVNDDIAPLAKPFLEIRGDRFQHGTMILHSDGAILSGKTDITNNWLFTDCILVKDFQTIVICDQKNDSNRFDETCEWGQHYDSWNNSIESGSVIKIQNHNEIIDLKNKRFQSITLNTSRQLNLLKITFKSVKSIRSGHDLLALNSNNNFYFNGTNPILIELFLDEMLNETIDFTGNLFYKKQNFVFVLSEKCTRLNLSALYPEINISFATVDTIDKAVVYYQAGDQAHLLQAIDNKNIEFIKDIGVNHYCISDKGEICDETINSWFFKGSYRSLEEALPFIDDSVARYIFVKNQFSTLDLLNWIDSSFIFEFKSSNSGNNGSLLLLNTNYIECNNDSFEYIISGQSFKQFSSIEIHCNSQIYFNITVPVLPEFKVYFDKYETSIQGIINPISEFHIFGNGFYRLLSGSYISPTIQWSPYLLDESKETVMEAIVMCPSVSMRENCLESSDLNDVNVFVLFEEPIYYPQFNTKRSKVPLYIYQGVYQKFSSVSIEITKLFVQSLELVSEKKKVNEVNLLADESKIISLSFKSFSTLETTNNGIGLSIPLPDGTIKQLSINSQKSDLPINLDVGDYLIIQSSTTVASTIKLDLKVSSPKTVIGFGKITNNEFIPKLTLDVPKDVELEIFSGNTSAEEINGLINVTGDGKDKVTVKEGEAPPPPTSSTITLPPISHEESQSSSITNGSPSSLSTGAIVGIVVGVVVVIAIVIVVVIIILKKKKGSNEDSGDESKV